MTYFNFDNLINKYSSDFTLLYAQNEAYNEFGDKTNTFTTVVKRGAIIGINDTKVYRSEGVLTVSDKDLFIKESLGDITKAYVIYDGHRFKVEANPQDNHKFTGVWHYTLKWISVFEEGDSFA
jgi:hypothetical protein